MTWSLSMSYRLASLYASFMPPSRCSSRAGNNERRDHQPGNRLPAIFALESLKQPQYGGTLLCGCGVVLCINKLLSSATAPYPCRHHVNCLHIMCSDFPTVIRNGLLSQCGPMNLSLRGSNHKQAVWNDFPWMRPQTETKTQVKAYCKTPVWVGSRVKGRIVPWAREITGSWQLGPSKPHRRRQTPFSSLHLGRWQPCNHFLRDDSNAGIIHQALLWVRHHWELNGHCFTCSPQRPDAEASLTIPVIYLRTWIWVSISHLPKLAEPVHGGAKSQALAAWIQSPVQDPLCLIPSMWSGQEPSLLVALSLLHRLITKIKSYNMSQSAFRNHDIDHMSY